jgi:anthraniloyl-CoA monooxygenase
MKLRNKDDDIIVVERNPARVTYGWGVVFWDDMLDNLYKNDPESAREIYRSAARYEEHEVHLRGKQTAYIGGYGFSIERKRLLEILAKRAMDLGADVRFESEVSDVSELADAELIVACDGVNSLVRQLYVDKFQTDVEMGRNKYVWLGTHKVFDAFTFGFEETDAGWIWFHAYRFNDDTSTFIVECSQHTWEAIGFGDLEPDENMALLEEIFEPWLDGYPLINQMRHCGKLPWLNFRTISNEKWYHQSVVLVGDAAHTTHFTIGSGTKLALEDAIGLAEKLHENEDVQAGLEAYELERRAALLTLQGEARESARWFETVEHHIDQGAVQFAYSMMNRRQVRTTPAEHYWYSRLTENVALKKFQLTQIPVLRQLRRYLLRRFRLGFRSARRELRARRFRASRYARST